MIKAMVFVDGGWLYGAAVELGRACGKPELPIDLKRLPEAVADEIGRQSSLGPIDLVRSHYFGSFAERCDPRDLAAVQRRKAFFARLEESHSFEVAAFGIDYCGRRLRRQDRDPDDNFVPREKCVDVALAVTAMRFALMPGAMDLAILVLGDRDFVPLLQEIRRLGKRVALATIDGACADELVDPLDPARLRDFDVIWINDLLTRMERCRARGARARPEAAFDEAGGLALRGRIKTIISDRGYGFIAAEDGRDYFFHANSLEAGLDFDQLPQDLPVVFEVKHRPTAVRAGAARLVRSSAGEPLAAVATATNETAALVDQPLGVPPAKADAPADPEPKESAERGGSIAPAKDVEQP